MPLLIGIFDNLRDNLFLVGFLLFLGLYLGKWVMMIIIHFLDDVWLGDSSCDGWFSHLYQFVHSHKISHVSIAIYHICIVVSLVSLLVSISFHFNFFKNLTNFQFREL